MGKFAPGHPKFGGRQPGVGNKPKPLAAGQIARILGELLPEDRIVNPLEAMALCLQWAAAEQDRAGVLQAATALAPYLHQRLNATTLTVKHEYAERDDQALLLEAEALELKIAGATRRLTN
jgi:hypothetical protein